LVVGFITADVAIQRVAAAQRPLDRSYCTMAAQVPRTGTPAGQCAETQHEHTS